MTSAEAAKSAGNDAFKAGDFKKAVEHFTEAIKAEPKNASFYSNRSAAHLKLNDTASALADANKCIELKPDWGKGYSRAGAALLVKGDVDEAIATYTKGLSVDPEDKVLEKALGQAQGKAGKKKRSRRNRKKKEKVEVEHDHVIGIDLGTTYSCVGVWKDGGVKILELPSGARTIPSYVAFTEDGERLVGQAAKAQAARNTNNTVFDVKRIIGQRWSDNGVEKDCSHFPFKVTPDGQGRPTIEVEEKGTSKEFQPEQISALVLSYCKKLAEDFLGEKVGKAVITVPAYFNDSQRNATKAAGAIAGLEVMRIINEPTAAALAYGLDSVVDTKAGFDTVNVLIFDLGGGTFDVSILSIEDGVFTVKATGGDTRLGGEDFDNNLIAYLHTEVEAQGITHVQKDKTGRAYQRLRKAAELAKRELSSAQTADIKIEDLMDGKTFELQLTRTKFEKLNTSLFTSCMATVERVLKDAKMKTKEINEIVMVGGSTRIPKIQEMLALEIFKGRTLCKSLNPDEAVAYGAAVQGAILSGRKISKTEDLLLMDVTPLSLGIETTGRVMSVIIPRNTPIPCVKTQTYTTESNYQTQVDVSVYEGERLKSDENNLLGEFTISGIQSAKRGEPQVDVSFSIDSNGILKVDAIDQKTKAKADITIANRSQASAEDVKRMVEEAERYKKEDEARIKKVEGKNELEATILEAMEMGREIADGKLGSILLEAAEKEQQWLDANYETATAGELGMRRATLNRRMAGQNRR